MPSVQFWRVEVSPYFILLLLLPFINTTYLVRLQLLALWLSLPFSQYYSRYYTTALNWASWPRLVDLFPFLVSQGDGNWLALFTYLCILNTGLIFLAYFKRWRVLNFIAFFSTEIIYLGWIINKVGTIGFNFQGIFIFGAVFYLMFIVMNVIHHVIRASKLTAFNFLILLSVNLSFYGAFLCLIQESGGEQFKGLFTASLGIINFLLAFLFYKRSKADKKLVSTC